MTVALVGCLAGTDDVDCWGQCSAGGCHWEILSGLLEELLVNVQMVRWGSGS